ncbi:MAG TPA: glycosyltransferase family 2 protein [Gemmatimonadaceae bacterium]|jgi:GT2 family glycosyltransferase|nr:glycosyltransferase family 2 protein [Gemmatimonadaceae bacterium]
MPRLLALSVVVPVRDSGSSLDSVLAAIRASELTAVEYEIIVVDDGSTDESVMVAARYADTVVRLRGPASGPAYARNRGAELACGDVVAFVDGDVLVGPDTLRRILTLFAERPDIDAVAASRDERSGAPNFVSHYWNLLVSFGEVRHGGECAHFAAGCAAVRRSVLSSAGMYDEWRFSKGGVEGLELGQRLLGAGHVVQLSSDLKVRHLKRWTLRSMCLEVWHRSMLLTRSLGYQRMSSVAPSDVVFTLSRAMIPALGIVATLTLSAAFVPRPYVVMKIAMAVVAFVLTNWSVHRYYARARGFLFALASAPLHLCVQAVSAVALCVGWILRDAFGDILPDAATQAYSEVGLETWPPVRRRP